MIVKFGSVAVVAAMMISAGLHPADARGAMPTLHDAWGGTRAEVLPAAYAQAPNAVAPRRTLAPRRHHLDALGAAKGM
jgi:hypothetical protein